MDELMDKNTVIEENVRKLRGLSFLLDRLATGDDLDPNESFMFGFLADAVESIGNDLESAMELDN